MNGSITPQQAQYDLGFQVSPIFLKGGIAAGIQGGLMPITTLTGGAPDNIDDAFARYLPLPGSTLISQSIAMYPFANQTVAANATIQEPLTLSLIMIAPVNQPGGYLTKLHTFTALQKSLQQHNASGGTYNVATPAFIYYDVLLVSMTDVTSDGEEQRQKQIQWQLDFIQPLVTLAQAAAAQGALIQRVSSGAQFTGTPAWSGNTSSSPADLAGNTAALGNVTSALSAFGGTP